MSQNPKVSTQKYNSRFYRDYEPMWEVGRGSFGIVYVAKFRNKQARNYKVIVKRTFPRRTPSAKFNLLDADNEVLALSKLRNCRHPNVVQILTALIEKPPNDWVEQNDPLFRAFMTRPDGKLNLEFLDSCLNSSSDEDDGDDGVQNDKSICPITIVQEYCRGGNLKDWLDANPHRDLDMLLDFATQMADGLRFLHVHGVIHRDLKPGNTFLSRELGSARIILKLGDFGLSKFNEKQIQPDDQGDWGKAKNSNCLTSASLGTHFYRSPEQLNGESYGFKVDLYALGLTIAELFLPSQTAYLDELKITAAAGQRMQGSSIVSQFPPRILQLVLKLLSNHPNDRPTASQTYSNLLDIARDKIKLPASDYILQYQKHPHLYDHETAAVIRPELTELLKIYHDGDEHLVFISGELGVGKTSLALQFVQTISTRDDTISIIWLDTIRQTEWHTQLENLAEQMRVSTRQDNGDRVTLKDLISGIHEAFRNEKWILVLDNFKDVGSSNLVILNFLNLQENPPFVIIVTNKCEHFKSMATKRYLKPKQEHADRFPIATALAEAWSHISETIHNPSEINVKQFGTISIALDFLCERLTLSEPKTLHKLGQLLDWHPLSLYLATCTIKAGNQLLSMRTLSKLSSSTVKNVEEYVALYLKTMQEFPINKVPEFHRAVNRSMVDKYPCTHSLKIVLHISMSQIEENFRMDVELLDTILHIQQFLILYADEDNLDKNTRVLHWALACKILTMYGLVREWVDSRTLMIKHSHICGLHCAALFMHGRNMITAGLAEERLQKDATLKNFLPIVN